MWDGVPLGPDEYVLCADEKTSIQCRCRCHPTLPPGKARSMRVNHDYDRGGVLAYLAAWDVGQAKVYARRTSGPDHVVPARHGAGAARGSERHPGAGPHAGAAAAPPAAAPRRRPRPRRRARGLRELARAARLPGAADRPDAAARRAGQDSRAHAAGPFEAFAGEACRLDEPDASWDAGLELEGLLAIEGPVWLFEERWADPAQRSSILRAIRAVEREPSLLGQSSHLLAVARRAG